MSHPMLSNSAAAIRKLNAEQSSRPAAQPALYGLAPGEEREDEPGEEMTRDARVWKTYVRETDRWDKELVDERTSSLDVLLIFAALFSAISTAFIIVSLGDLKPDSADLAVQTQQAILHALVQISNSQSVSPLIQNRSDGASFTPPWSAVVVNVLWLLSLALSVGVSLIAMLAKGWCYQFIRSRLGPTYDQARRRQQKWDGIERWKMQELLEFLPGAMHLAVLLFAIGLCVYLWKVHTAVATPVTVVTGGVVFGYMLATELPAVDRYCPYRTPFTSVRVLSFSVLWWFTAFPVLLVVSCFSFLAMALHWDRAETVCGDIIDRLTLYQTHENHPSPSPSPDGDPVPMDMTASRMLAWLITYCDDSRSVDVALQALAGASSSLPCLPLALCDAHKLLPARLWACAKPYAKPEEAIAEDRGKLLVALRYVRSYTALVGSDLESYVSTPATRIPGLDYALAFEFSQVLESYQVILNHSCRTFGAREKAVWLAAASSTDLIALIKYHGNSRVGNLGQMSRSLSYHSITIDPIVHILQRHTTDVTNLDDATGYLLVHAVAQYLTQCDPNECHQQGALYETLVQLCITPGDTVTNTSHMAATALATAAFMLGSYPAGKGPPWPVRSDRSRRALEVLEFYRHQEPDEDTMAALFAFSLPTTLPSLEPRTSGIQTETWARMLHLLFTGINSLNHRTMVHSLPDGYSLDEHTSSRAGFRAYLPAALDLSTGATSWSAILRTGVGPEASNPVLYIPALAALCRTRSAQVQQLCMSILDSQPAELDVPDMLHLLRRIDFRGDLVHEQNFVDASGTSTARFYFRLLTAGVMLCPSIQVPDRRYGLWPLMASWKNFRQLRHSRSDHSLPTIEAILAHVAEDTDQQTADDCMRQTMQLIYDFYYADLMSVTPDPACPDWAERLHAIRCRHRPEVRGVGSTGALDLAHGPPTFV